MNSAHRLAGDSVDTHGGEVPGQPGVPAFTLRTMTPSPIPIVVAVPHAGRTYPGALVESLRHPTYAALRLEDRYVDLLASEIARCTGATMLMAHAPRAMIDLNRASDDIDWEMIIGGAPAHPVAAEAVASGIRRARNGLGLVPRRLPGLGDLWKRRIERDELSARIDSVHIPYHAALGKVLADIRARWGAALLIDLHSMPPLHVRANEPVPEFVIGDRFGAACDGALVSAVFAYLDRAGRCVTHNRPYAGGYVLERHAHRAEGIHCIQLEIARSAYLDRRLAEPGEGLGATAELLVGLVRAIADTVAEHGRHRQRWREAAE